MRKIKKYFIYGIIVSVFIISIFLGYLKTNIYAKENEDCKHLYEQKEISATCSSDGYTIYTCVYCNETYKDNYIERLNHDFEEKVIDVSCEDGSYISYTCRMCGFNYKEITSKNQ